MLCIVLEAKTESYCCQDLVMNGCLPSEKLNPRILGMHADGQNDRLRRIETLSNFHLPLALSKVIMHQLCGR